MFIKRAAAWVLTLLLITCAAFAEGEFPPFGDDGFLAEGEFLFEDAEAGVWRYASPTLTVEVRRYAQTSPKQVWYEAEVFTTGGELFDVIPNSQTKRMTRLEYPYKIARKNQTVLGISADFAHLRISQHKGTGVGIIIRDGKILSARTHSHNKKSFPNLDTMAFFPDGRMEANVCDAYTAEEYLEAGATDVLAFGPWLIHEGVKNTALAKATTEHAQRAAIGMVEPGHYWLMMLEGRTKTSKGDTVVFLAEKLFERGCTEALNLDGGQSACMVFMGRQLNEVVNKSGRKASARKAAEIIGVGTSALVPAVDSGAAMTY